MGRGFAVAIALAGCGRVGFEERSLVTSDGAGDGVADTTGDGSGTAVCSGTVFSMCPPATAPFAITTGGHVHTSGDTSLLGDGMAGTCGGNGAGELIVQLDVGSFGFYTVSTAGSTFDTVVYVLDGGCTPAQQFDCIDAAVGTGGETLMLGLAHAGTFYVIVDGKPGACGHVELDVQG